MPPLGDDSAFMGVLFPRQPLWPPAPSRKSWGPQGTGLFPLLVLAGGGVVGRLTFVSWTLAPWPVGRRKSGRQNLQKGPARLPTRKSAGEGQPAAWSSDPSHEAALALRGARCPEGGELGTSHPHPHLRGDLWYI